MFGIEVEPKCKTEERERTLGGIDKHVSMLGAHVFQDKKNWKYSKKMCLNINRQR